MKKSNYHPQWFKPLLKAAMLFAALAFTSTTVNAQYSVDWTNGANVSITSGKVTKNAGFTGFNAGAISTNELPACVDGSFEYVASNITGTNFKYIGFTTNGSWGNPATDILYGFFINSAAGTWQFYTNGTLDPSTHAITNGDKFKFERIGNQVILTSLNCIDCFIPGSNVKTISGIPTPSTIWNVAVNIWDIGDYFDGVTATFAQPKSCNIELWDRDNSTGSVYNVYQSDKVGIGTLTPSDKLDVNGTLRVRTTTQDNALTRFAVLDANGVLKFRDNLNLNPFGGWFQQGTTTLPTSITDNIYTNGRVRINQQLEVNATIAAWGGTLSGGTYDRFVLYADNTNGLLMEGPRATNSNGGTRLPVTLGWRGDATPGIYITHSGISPRVGIGTNNPVFALSVNGAVGPTTDGNRSLGSTLYRWSQLWAVNATIQTSDLNAKTNIQDLKYGIKDIMELRAVTYDWKENPNGTRIGFIAQELENTINEVVVNEEGRYGVRYTEIIPVLVKGIQEQQITIETQNAKIAKLEKDVEEIKTLLKQQGTLPKTSESSVSNYIQIRPNPTYGKTSVDYSITENYTTAKLIVYNELGQMVGEYKVTQKGMGSVDVDATSFSGGIYFCNLVVDGNIKEVKKFIVSK